MVTPVVGRSKLQIIGDHYAASARADIATMMVDVADDVRWIEMAGFPCAGVWVGPQAVVNNVFAVLGREWQDYRFELDRLIDGGDQIVGVGAYIGIYRATGKPMLARATHVWTLRNAKIVAFEQFTDTLLVARAMQ
ncbi:nuclear transport factor 2 family protein [Alcaligenaceae bacterium B3P038]|nr:nuclear transport factor 2 family protein [Alcaligenaceae bacterium B3P038]